MIAAFFFFFFFSFFFFFFFSFFRNLEVRRQVAFLIRWDTGCEDAGREIAGLCFESGVGLGERGSWKVSMISNTWHLIPGTDLLAGLGWDGMGGYGFPCLGLGLCDVTLLLCHLMLFCHLMLLYHLMLLSIGMVTYPPTYLPTFRFTTNYLYSLSRK